MPRQARISNHNPTWVEAGQYVRDLEIEYKRSVVVQVNWTPDTFGRLHCWVGLHSWERIEAGEKKGFKMIDMRFPGKFKTVPAAIIWLCYELEKDLSDVRRKNSARRAR